MLLKLDVQRGGGSADRSQILTVHVVGNAVSALGKAPQRNSATPLRRIEGVVHTAVLANRVSIMPVNASKSNLYSHHDKRAQRWLSCEYRPMLGGSLVGPLVCGGIGAGLRIGRGSNGGWRWANAKATSVRVLGQSAGY